MLYERPRNQWGLVPVWIAHSRGGGRRRGHLLHGWNFKLCSRLSRRVRWRWRWRYPEWRWSRHNWPGLCRRRVYLCWWCWKRRGRRRCRRCWRQCQRQRRWQRLWRHWRCGCVVSFLVGLAVIDALYMLPRSEWSYCRRRRRRWLGHSLYSTGWRRRRWRWNEYCHGLH